MRTPPAFFLLAALLAFLLAGCANNGRIVATGLRIEVTKIERASDGTVSVSWQMANPNVVSYIISHETHKVYLNNIYLGLVTDKDPLGVPANNTARRTSKLAGLDAAADRVLTEAAASGSGSYRIDSRVVFLIYGDSTETADLTNTGTAAVTAK